MDEYFSGDELPHARQIVREDFGDDVFDAGEFLMRFHQFQTLSDLRKQLQEWDQTLSDELVDIINEEFDDFVELGRSLGLGAGKASDVQAEVVRFRREVASIRDDMTATAGQLDRLLRDKRALGELETRATALLYYLEHLEDAEAQAKALASGARIDGPGLEQAVRTFSALRAYDTFISGHSAVAAAAPRVARLRSDLAGMCRTHVMLSRESANSSDLLRLLAQAREVA